jgi:hypothetical protein
MSLALYIQRVRSNEVLGIRARPLRSDFDQLHTEFQHRVWRNARNLLISVPKMGADPDSALSPNAHSLDTILQASNYLAPSELKGVGLIGLHDVATIQRERIDNLNVGPALRHGTLTNLQIFELDTAAPAFHEEDA